MKIYQAQPNFYINKRLDFMFISNPMILGGDRFFGCFNINGKIKVDKFEGVYICEL